MKLREEEFYEQYHQHGGTTIIPTEIFNELYDDATEEIERLNNIINGLDNTIKNLEEVVEHKDNIIKEVREYINGIGWNTTIPNIQDNVWRILDKENNNEGN